MGKGNEVKERGGSRPWRKAGREERERGGHSRCGADGRCTEQDGGGRETRRSPPSEEKINKTGKTENIAAGRKHRET